jgi:hypothetical protein
MWGQIRFQQARARGELPSYLSQPLDELQRLLKKPAR